MPIKALFNKKHIISFLLISLSAALFSQREAHQFAVVKQLEILSNNTVSSFYQSENGIMWINSNAGLIRFNGNSAETIAFPLSMKPILGCSDFLFCSMNTGLLRINIKTNEQDIILQDEVRGDSSHISVHNSDLFVGQGNIVRIYHDTICQKEFVLPKNEVITQLYSNSEGKTWIGTEKGTVYILSINHTFKSLAAFSSEITTLFSDSKGLLWVGTMSNGAYRVNKKGSIKRFATNESVEQKISNNLIRSFCEDKYGQIWMATLDGVNVLNNSKQEIVSFPVGPTKEKSVWALYPDQQGNIWVGTYYSGVYFFNASTAAFYLFTTNDKITMVNRMIEDKRGDVWIFTDGFGVFRQKANGFAQLILSTIKKAKSAYYDRERDLIWIGTYLEGLYCYSIAQNQLTKVRFKEGQMNINTATVNDIICYEEILYIGTTHGVFSIDMNDPNKTHAISTYQSLVHSLLIDKEKELWIAGIGVYKYNFTHQTTQNVIHNIDISFPDDAQYKWVYQDKSGKMWISALRYGLLMIDNHESVLLTDQNIGLGDNFISTISQTADGILLLGSNSGLSLYFPEEKRCESYNASNGFPLRSTRNGCILHLNSGEILIGGTTGVSTLSINSVNTNQPKSIYFDRLRVNNKNIDVLGEMSIDNLSLTYTKGISLTHLQKNLAIEVASSDLLHTQYTFYEYMLKGFDSEWTRFSLRSPIIYMNLPPGKYVLKVRSSSGMGMRKVSEIQLPIRVIPPWYGTHLAMSMYILFALLLVFGVFYFFYSRLLFREQLKQQEETARARLRFFTNVSHEIRTPLTLITGHLEMLVNKSRKSGSQTSDIMSAYKNSKKMQELVNELLDFEKQALGYKQLSVSKRNFNAFINHVYSSFGPYAAYREITFNIHVQKEDLSLYYDYSQLQKVLFNLLMNAFKYTPNGGNILIQVTVEELNIPTHRKQLSFMGRPLSSSLFIRKKKTKGKMLVLRVSDSGQGMSNQKINQIFDPFYQDTTHLSYDKHNKGTGIGLSIAKNIIEQHHGYIWTESRIGEGTVFTVALPTNEYWFNEDPGIKIIAEGESDAFDKLLNVVNYDESIDQSMDENQLNNKKEELTKKKILIVEDDDELKSLLHSIFSPIFNVITASNGLEGFSIAQEQQPDIIVSDIMMPVMDGLEFCSNIKGSLITSHIPVILLTAQSTETQNIEGICAGADDYIIKPFSIEVLIAKCNSLLHHREVLIQKYRHSISTSADTIVSNVQDTLFLKKLVSVIEKHIGDEQLGVPFLCSELAMSKTLLSNKTKGITDQSPAEFIQTLKMKRAAWMILNEPHKTVSDIAYELGFSSLSYFGIRFKKYFGKSPSDLKNERNAEDSI